jgi:predicted transcriptional regulator of viral defense system
MKYYRDLANLGVFRFKEASHLIGSDIATSKYLENMISRKIVKRIRRDLYTCVDLATSENVADRYQIGSHISTDSFILGHTAFEFYGFYNQVFNEVQVGSAKRFQDFAFDSLRFRCFLSCSDCQVIDLKGARITSLERTVIDSINSLGKVMDCEELVKCLQLIPILDEGRLREMLVTYDKDVLYRKTGYLLSFFKKEFRLSDDFFAFCHSHSRSNTNGSLSSHENQKLTFIPAWHLYAYEDPTLLATKGGDLDV